MSKYVARYSIASSSSSSRHYTVSFAPDGVGQCSCVAWTRKRIRCKHIAEAERVYHDDIAMTFLRYYRDIHKTLPITIAAREWYNKGVGIEANPLTNQKPDIWADEPPPPKPPRKQRGKPAVSDDDKTALERIKDNARWRLK